LGDFTDFQREVHLAAVTRVQIDVLLNGLLEASHLNFHGVDAGL
jgi:hypothetical protein